MHHNNVAFLNLGGLETAQIQECHIVVVHLLCALIEQGLELA